jgi:hypothetical protein
MVEKGCRRNAKANSSNMGRPSKMCLKNKSLQMKEKVLSVGKNGKNYYYIL